MYSSYGARKYEPSLKGCERPYFCGTHITITTPHVGFVPKLVSSWFHRPLWSWNTGLSTLRRDGAGKVLSFEPECELRNPSISVDPILNNFAPLDKIVSQLLPNSSTCLLLLFHTASPKIVRAKLPWNPILANLGSWVRPWCWCWCRCRPRSRGA